MILLLCDLRFELGVGGGGRESNKAEANVQVCVYSVQVCVYRVQVCVYSVQVCVYSVQVCVHSVQVCIHSVQVAVSDSFLFTFRLFNRACV